jgi:hypothetical protein
MAKWFSRVLSEEFSEPLFVDAPVFLKEFTLSSFSSGLSSGIFSLLCLLL